MTIFIVDNSSECLEQINEIVGVLSSEAEVLCFTDSLEALAAARTREVDIAFLEVETEELSGLDLGRYLKDLYPLINLIYVTGTRDYGYEAMALHASGYILKPVEEAAVKNELTDLRHSAVQKNHKRVFARTFGNFEIFADGEPISFKYSRTKEIMAVLVNNRGAQTTNGEIIACLWEDDGDPDKKRSYLSNLRQDLQNTLTKLKLNGLIIKKRGSMAIAVDKIECDLYDWMDKKKESNYHYLGDYMNQYSWAEYTHAELDEIFWAIEDSQ